MTTSREGPAPTIAKIDLLPHADIVVSPSKDLDSDAAQARGESQDMGTILGALLLLVFGPACSSSPLTEASPACTLIGCQDGLTVDLEPGEGWPAGEYRFLLEWNDVQVTCRGSLPLPACNAGRALACEPAGVVTVVESGCALPASAHGFTQIFFDPKIQPATMRVAVERSHGASTTVLASTEFSLRFETTQPNGPGCPPTCRQAGARVNVQFTGH